MEPTTPTTQKEQSFIDKESRERFLAKHFYNHKCIKTGNCYDVVLMAEKYCPYDALISKDGVAEAMVGIKVRENYTFAQIERWGGSFLELTKLTGMLTRMATEGLKTKIHYVNFYRDYVIVYELSTDISDYTWEMVNLQGNDYEKEPKWKLVTKLERPRIVEVMRRQQRL